MDDIISDLERLIRRSDDEAIIRAYEHIVADNIEEVVNDNSFYTLPIKTIINILQYSIFDNFDSIKTVVRNISAFKGFEAPLILNSLDIEIGSLNDYAEVFSCFRNCPICKRINDIFERDQVLGVRDYKGELEIFREKVTEMNNKLEKLKAIVYKKPMRHEENIIKAAEKGKIKSIQYLVEICKVDVNEHDSKNRTALHEAVENGYNDIVEYLTKECNANVEAQDLNNIRALHIAVSRNNLNMTKYLIEECHANIEEMDIMKRTPFIIAVQQNNYEIARYLYEVCHADVDKKDDQGRTPLIFAVSNGNLNMVKFLYEECNADIEKTGTSGITTFIIAVQQNNYEIASYIYSVCHPIVDKKDNFGRTPFIFAVSNGDLNMVKFLYEDCQVDPNIKCDHNFGALHIASWKGFPEIVDYLITKCSLKVNDSIENSSKHFPNWTPLCFAASEGNLSTVKLLVEKFKAFDYIRVSSFDRAIEYGQIDIVKYYVKIKHVYNLDCITKVSTKGGEKNKIAIKKILEKYVPPAEKLSITYGW